MRIKVMPSDEVAEFEVVSSPHLQENIDALLAALEVVEWVGDVNGDAPKCPWCDGFRDIEDDIAYPNVDGAPGHGHAPDCQRQAALAKAKGEDDERDLGG